MPTKRRAQGEGTIFERVDEQGVKWFVGRVSLGRWGGKRVRKDVWRHTQREVIAEMNRLKADAQVGRVAQPERTTVGEAIGSWIADRKRGGLRLSTIARYESTIEKWIRPWIGTARLQSFGHRELEAFYKDVQKARREKGRKVPGASDSTLRKIHQILNPAFHAAMRREIIMRNPCDLVDTPSYESPERNTYDLDQIKAFLKVVAGDPLEALYIMALFTTAREGELLVLRRRDIDLANRVVYVRRTLTDVGSGKRSIGNPKTKAARRGILLPEIALDALKAHIKAGMGKRAVETDLLFHDTAGGTLRRQNLLRRSLYPLQEKAGLPRITFHDLRHSGASILKAHGVDSTVIQKRLGHTRVSTTDDIYIHVPIEIQRPAIAAIDELFPKAVGGGTGGGKPPEEPGKVFHV